MGFTLTPVVQFLEFNCFEIIQSTSINLVHEPKLSVECVNRSL